MLMHTLYCPSSSDMVVVQLMEIEVSWKETEVELRDIWEATVAWFSEDGGSV